MRVNGDEAAAALVEASLAEREHSRQGRDPEPAERRQDIDARWMATARFQTMRKMTADVLSDADSKAQALAEMPLVRLDIAKALENVDGVKNKV